MPRLPHLSGREIAGALQRLGFEIARQRGSPMLMRRGSAGCVVPDHREVKIGTLSDVPKQAGVSVEEFLDVLK